MAQTGYTPILIYASGTTGNTPSASNLTSSASGAELALNYFDGKLFYKDASGNVQVLAGKGGSGVVAGSNTQVQFNNNGVFGASSGLTWDGTNFTASQLRSSGLTSGRVTYASTSGLLVDSANMTFNGTRLTVADLADSGLTSGRVVYASTGGALVDSANLLYSGTDLTVYGLTVGRGAGAVSTNTAVGANALVANTTGATSTAVGSSALATNTTGSANTAVGRESMVYNTTGGENAAVGANALWSNTTGGRNTAVGFQSLFSSTTSSNNVAVGWNAGYTNTTGTQNTAVGSEALRLNATGSYNTAVGYYALRTATAGGNTALGYYVLANSTTGIENVGVGGSGIAGGTLVNNTTGSYNTALGNGALSLNTTASNNTAVGFQAGYSNTTGTVNTYFGQVAGYANTAGDAQAFFGASAGQNTTGSSNTFIGGGSGYLVTTGAKNTILGRYTGNQDGLDIRTSNNVIVLSDGDGNANFLVRRNSGGGYFLSGPTRTDPSGGNYYSVISSQGSDVQLILQRVGDAGAGWSGIGASSSAAFIVYDQGLVSVPFRVNQTDGTVILKGGNAAATGTGIAFPASQTASSNANTLDDYEEGSWTPSIYGSSTVGTQSGTRSGTYVKIGRFVYMTAQFTAYTLSGAAGNITLTGLPFSMTTVSGMSVYLEGINPVYSGTPDDNISLSIRQLDSTNMAFGPTVSNGWDSYMTGSTTWTGGGGSTYGTITLWGIASN